LCATGMATRSAVGANPPHVTGLRTDRGDLPADLVVDATGRRSPIDDWLAVIGARPTATWFAECGIAYYSRHYRVRQAAELPGLPVTRTVIGTQTARQRPAGGPAHPRAVARRPRGLISLAEPLTRRQRGLMIKR